MSLTPARDRLVAINRGVAWAARSTASTTVTAR